MYQANEQLRGARERLPSRQTPGECLSRQEVAEFVNAWIFAKTGQTVVLDANYIGKLERGVIRWPSRLYRQALRAVLRTETDVQLGFYLQRRRSASVRDMDRQQFLRLSGAVMALPWLDLLMPVEPTSVPGSVGQTEINQVLTAATVFRSWDYAHGGGLAREAIAAPLRWAAQLLHADCSEKLRPELFAAVAQLSNVAGFMHFDAYAHEDARRSLRFALACAEHSGDWHLRARVLDSMAHQALWCDRPDEGLTLLETALVRADLLTATERAAMHALKAGALARLHRSQDALTSVGAADEAFAHAMPTEDPAWMAYYDQAQHHHFTGRALFHLSVAGERTEAGQRLAYAVAHHADIHARSWALARTKLASLRMAVGDPHEAVTVGSRAVDAAASLRSGRARDDLRELHRFTARHTAIPAVRELRDRLTETVGVG